MQSAFIDLGLERDGFLYVADVVATFEEFDQLETDEDDAGRRRRGDGAGQAAAAAAAAARREREKGPSRRSKSC